jgi:hypothetical protein
MNVQRIERMYGWRMERSVIAGFGVANIDAVLARRKNATIRDSLNPAVHGLLLRPWARFGEILRVTFRPGGR